MRNGEPRMKNRFQFFNHRLGATNNPQAGWACRPGGKLPAHAGGARDPGRWAGLLRIILAKSTGKGDATLALRLVAIHCHFLAIVGWAESSPSPLVGEGGGAFRCRFLGSGQQKGEARFW